LWNTPLGTKTHSFGTANSPVLHKDLVIVNAGVESGAIVALNKQTGEKVWQWEGVRRSWNTPILVDLESGTELVFNDESVVRGINPDTGEGLWECQAMDDYICPSVIAVGDMLYAVGARKNKTIAIKAGGRGDVTDTHLVWELDKGSNVSSPAYHEGHLYWVSEGNGIAYCADAETGKLIYEQRLNPRPGRIYASPVIAGGNIYYVSRENGTYVLPAKPMYELVAHNTFESDNSIFNGSPAVVDNKMYLRSDKALYCIGK
jgi:outer membrane protein assembly factor BamB